MAPRKIRHWEHGLKRQGIALAGLALVVFFANGRVCAEPSARVFRLTNNNDLDVGPHVSGTTYVWDQERNIMLFSEGDSAPTALTNDFDNFTPRISGDRIVFVKDVGARDVFLWDGGVLTNLTNTPTIDETDPDVSGVDIVWREEFNGIRYDDGSTVTLITDAESDGQYVRSRVAGGWVIWDGLTSPTPNTDGVNLWRSGSITRIASEADIDSNQAETDGVSIVWQRSSVDNSVNDIYMWRDGEGVTQITNDGANHTPDVSGDVITYMKHDGNDFEIFFYVLGAEYQVTDNDYNDLTPKVDGSRLVWTAQMGSGSANEREIFYAIIDGLDGVAATGACCIGVECIRDTEEICLKQGGTFLGAQTLCDVDSCGTAPASTWSTFQHDHARTGRTSAVVPDDPVRIWRLFIGDNGPTAMPPFFGPTPITPSIAPDGTLFPQPGSPNRIGVNPDGTVRWSVFNTGSGEPKLYAPVNVREDGNFFGYVSTQYQKGLLEDGAAGCQSGTTLEIGTAAMDAEGNSFLPIGSDAAAPWTLRKISPSCDVLWEYAGADGVASDVAYSPNGEAIVASRFAIVAVDETTGLESWTFPTTGRAGRPSVHSDGTIYFVEVPNILRALNPDGTEAWNLPITGVSLTGPPFAPAIGADGTAYVSVESGGAPLVVSVSPAGSENWRTSEPAATESALPVVLDGADKVLFTAADVALIALDASDGSELWRHPIDAGDAFRTSPTIAEDGTAYLVTRSGDLIALGLGCPAIPRFDPPFSYRKVAEEGEFLEGFELDGLNSVIDLTEEGLVSFVANVNGDGVGLLEESEGVFRVYAPGDVIDGFELDRVGVPKRDRSGNVYMFATMLLGGRVVLKNDEIIVAERLEPNAPVLVDSFAQEVVDFDDFGNIMILARRAGNVTNEVLLIDTETFESTLLTDNSQVIDGFDVDSITLDGIHGIGNDGVPIVSANNGQFAVVTPTHVLARTGDVVDELTIGAVRFPRRTESGTVYMSAGTYLLRSDASGGPTSVAVRPSLTLGSQHLLEPRGYATNELEDLAIAGPIVGSAAVLLNRLPVVVEDVSVIDGVPVVDLEALATLFNAVSVNDRRQVAFYARREGEGRALWVASLSVFDTDEDGDIDGVDLGVVEPCFEAGDPPSCVCQLQADSTRDLSVDCDDWADLKRTWTGPPAAPTFRAACDTDCNGNSIADEFDLESGAGADCNLNGTLDSCDIAAGEPDDNGNGVPDICECAPAAAPLAALPGPENRYLTITPQSAGSATALRVTLEQLHAPDPPVGGSPDFSAFNGQVRWVGPPSEYPEGSGETPTFFAAELQCEPHFADWSAFGTISVFGDAILPSSAYVVQAIDESCNGSLGDESRYSAGAAMTTARWGDVTSPFQPPSEFSQPNINDILLIVDKFLGAFPPLKSSTQLLGNAPDPNLKPDINDILLCVDSFLGQPYPYAGPSTCP